MGAGLNIATSCVYAFLSEALDRELRRLKGAAAAGSQAGTARLARVVVLE